VKAETKGCTFKPQINSRFKLANRTMHSDCEVLKEASNQVKKKEETANKVDSQAKRKETDNVEKAVVAEEHKLEVAAPDYMTEQHDDEKKGFFSQSEDDIEFNKTIGVHSPDEERNRIKNHNLPSG